MKTFITIIALVALGFVFRNDIQSMFNNNGPAYDQKGKDKKEKKEESAGDVNITARWELPEILKEVSGISHLGRDRFACVQDEEGNIYIFNSASNKIEETISFAGPGDYEGISVVGNTAWVVRADGTLFEVKNFREKPDTKEHSTFLTVAYNIEGLGYDKVENRLLVAAKEDDPDNPGTKVIYAYDLSSNTLERKPAYSFTVPENMLKSGGGKKKARFMSSEIAIHPKTGELYITDGVNSNLLIMSRSGEIKQLLSLGKDFSQSEGITFNSENELFISNEGKKKSANILQVRLN